MALPSALHDKDDRLKGGSEHEIGMLDIEDDLTGPGVFAEPEAAALR